MRILSYNSRGMGGTSKKNALKRLFNNQKASIIMIRETMLEGDKAEATFKEILKSWEVEILDVVGHSRGLITTWSPTLKKIESRKLASAIKVKLQDQNT